MRGDFVAIFRRRRRDCGIDCAKGCQGGRSSVASAPLSPMCSTSIRAEARLAVEIDGMSHDLGDRPQRDASRDARLKARGLTVMRIAALEAMRDADEVAEAIVRTATEMIRASAPSPALTRGPPPPLAGEEGPMTPATAKRRSWRNVRSVRRSAKSR